MKLERTSFVPILALIVIASLAAPALAQGQGGGPPEGAVPGARARGGPGASPLGPVGGILRQLELDDVQRDEVRGLVHDAMQTELGEALRAHETERRALEQLVWLTDADDAAVIAAFEESATTHEAVTLERARLARSIRAVLTDEQNARFDELLAELPDRPTRTRQHQRAPRAGRS